MMPHLRTYPFPLLLTLALAFVLGTSLVSAQPVISEFMASNGRTLADEDGDYPDWIELQNQGTTDIDLTGYYLTDDAGFPAKWAFPHVTLPAQGHLVVFASSKNRTNNPSQLHTNFSLDAAGEYLALIAPNGQTALSEFSPTFPPQERDLSYGLAELTAATPVLTEGAAARFMVPNGPDLSADWTGQAFDDQSWLAGPTGLGYETAVSGFSVKNIQAATSVTRLSTAEQIIATPALHQSVTMANSSVVNFYGTGTGGHYPNNLTFPGHTIGVDYDDFVLEVTATLTIPTAGEWTFGVSSDNGFGLEIRHPTNGAEFHLESPAPRNATEGLGVFQVPTPGDYELRLVSFDRTGSSFLELFASPGNHEAWNGPDFRLVGDTGNGGLGVRSLPVGGTGTGYRSLIATDLEAVLQDHNASLYVRSLFDVPVADPTSLFLSIRYDDGFVAYLNGQEVARRNAPSTLAWNTSATTDRTIDQAMTAELVNLSSSVNLLQPTGNVLAFHALNVRADDTDFLLIPELINYESSGIGYAYFASPSPGTYNGKGSVALVGDTQFTVDRGFFSEPFQLEVASATPGVTIYISTDGTDPSPASGSPYTGPITIDQTTILRAAAYKEGYLPSDIDTQTYLFLDDVVQQSPNGVAPLGWPASWGGNTVDYGMDPNVVNDPRWNSEMQEALLAIPSFSIVMRLSDLFSSSIGIYANPGQDGLLWERPCSVELIHPDGTDGFQIDAGIRIRGGFSRSTSNPKHAFRLFFRREYGKPKLRYPLFGDEGTGTFDNLDLRTFQNYSWSFQGDSRGIFVRDQINRDLQLAMGHQAERGEFYHLYINGQYWGLYNTCERPEASYGATYYGGNQEDYDVLKVEAGPYTINATDGNMNAWSRLYQLAQAGFDTDASYEFIQGNNPDGTPNASYEDLVEIDNLIDYMLIILYGGNLDAPISNFLGNSRPNNWYGVRNRTGAFGGFRFFVHDAEHTLLDVNQNRTGPWSAGNSSVVYSNPQWIWQKLQANAEFRMQVADHIHRHFFNDGVLSPTAVAARFEERTSEIQQAVIAESARWGDAKREPPLSRNSWISTVNSVLNNYIPRRSDIVVNQLRTDSLYPSVVAPAFNQHGGNINDGFPLTITAPAGSVYYTLDGSDPRLRGGAISPAAIPYTTSRPLNRSTTVKARAYDNGTWSALNEAAFTIIRTYTNLFITEFMYHPVADTSGIDPEEFEFVELKNVGSALLDLSGVTFTDGIRYTFPIGSELAPGEFVVLVPNATAFVQRYPGVSFDGVYTGRLNNGGEAVTLTHAAGDPIFSVTYDDTDPWVTSADGIGFSLVPLIPDTNPTPNEAASWRASSAVNGSPGRDDPAVDIPPIWITEALTHTDPPQIDTVELHNPNDVEVDVSHWYLTDDRDQPRKYRLPPNTRVAPGSYLVLDETDYNPTPGVDPSFSLSSYGEQAYLYSGNAAGDLTGYSDGFRFGAAANGVSFGRLVISSGQARYPAQILNTLGEPNAGPRIGPVIINEIQYHPAIGESEFIELKNITDTPVPLFDPDNPANRWKIAGIDFTFPEGAELAPQGLALVVEGEPQAFRTRHSVSGSVPVYGPFLGLLQNNGERIELRRPDHPDLLTNGTVIVPYITVDSVRYDNLPPWPTGTDGTGDSLERIRATAFGEEPLNWRASPGQPSPGLENTGNRRPEISVGHDIEQTLNTFPAAITLQATVTDDGTPPPGQITVTWAQISGPGQVLFRQSNSAITTAFFPGIGSYAVRATASDGALESSDDLVVTLSRSTSTLAFIPQRATWNYYDQGTLPAPNWAAPTYDDNAWPSGPAQLGYGDNDEATTVSFGPNPAAKYITTWFRHGFSVADPAGIQDLQLSVMRDDGIVLYLNGQEIYRNNMPVSAIDETTYATGVVGGGDESNFLSAPVDAALLQAGPNVIAAEIHQANAGSSDISFDLSLVGDAFPGNRAPTVNAGPDLDTAVTLPIQLQGEVIDDGLPAPPGLVTFTWSQLAGPATATIDNPHHLYPRVLFPVPGSYTFEFAATDGTLAGNDTVTVTVGGETFETWLALFFNAAELADPSIAGTDADPDTDGHSNIQEYAAGTIPTDGSSVLHLDQPTLHASPTPETRLTFPAIAQRSYTVQYTDHPSLLDADWQRLIDVDAAATNRLVEVIDPSASTDQPRYYRLLTPQAP